MKTQAPQVRSSRPALERLEQAFAYVYERQKELRDKHGCVLGCPFSSVGTEIIAAHKALRDAVQAVTKQKIRYFESALRDLQAEGRLAGQDPAMAARQVYLYYEGVLAQARIVDDLEMLRTVLDGAMRLIGVGPPVPVVA